MKLKSILCLLLLTLVKASGRVDGGAAAALPRSTPEKQGVSSAAIQAFVQAADAQVDAMHSFMLVRHGNVVAEGWWTPYGAQIPHTMFSVSKSFTSTAVGLAIADGKLSLDDAVLKFFPEDAPARPSDNLKAMRVRDLLIMSSGQHGDAVSRFSFDTNEPLTREFLAMPVEHKPGTFWYYNTPGSYMLSAIVQKVTGQTMLDYLRPRLFEPLGIENPEWETSPQGISLGGYGLHIKTEDMARFGLLYLNKGKWRGKQLVPADWVTAATTRQTANGSNPRSDSEQGYDYQFWQCRHGCYRADGAFGQLCIVMPEQDAIVVMTAGTTNTATMMNLVWDILLPAMQAKPLRANQEHLQALHETLGRLTLDTPQSSALPAAAALSGRRFLFPANDQHIEAVSLEFGNADGSATLGMRYNGVEQKIRCGPGAWVKDLTTKTRTNGMVIGVGSFLSGPGDWVKGHMTFVSDAMNPPAEQPLAASGAWTADGVYTAKLAFYETPFCITLTLRFEGGQLFYTAESNATRRQPAKLPTLTGTAEN